MQKMSDIERILYMGIGRSGLENENRVISEALKELQDYKAIGTVEECREAVESMKGEEHE